MTTKYLILVVIMEDMDLGINIQDTFPLIMVYKVFMVIVEVDIGLIPSPIPPTIQVSLVDCSLYMFMVMIEVAIGLRPSTFIHITMVEYTLSAQGYLNKLFQEVYEEKMFKKVIKSMSYIHIKIILTILIQSCNHTLIQ